LTKQAGHQGLTFPLATSIVMSGVYEDDFDKADEIIYTGEGGNNLLGNSHQKTNQTLLRGNLALKVSSCRSLNVLFVQTDFVISDLIFSPLFFLCYTVTLQLQCSHPFFSLSCKMFFF
jgi:hypothetical protein